MTLVVVTGTGTEVGKTWITAATTTILRGHGMVVHARKPVQSYAAGDPTTDADVLAAATGESSDVVCLAHRRYARAMAPPMAAAALRLPPFTIADLVAELRVPPTGITVVEGAGGLRSPIADDGDTLSLIDACDPNLVVLVADAGLGTINLVRLCVDALHAHRTVVYLNHYDARDDLHPRNREWLTTREGLDVVVDVEALAQELLNPISR